MCKASEYVKQLTDIYKNICEEHEKLDLELIKLNAQQQDLLHMVENEDIGVENGFKLAQAIKGVRLQRRTIKNELGTIKSLRKGFIDDSLETLNKVAQEIKAKDELLKSLEENKVYKKRVVDGELVYSANPMLQKKINFKPNAKTQKGYLTQIIEDGEYCTCIVKHGGGYQQQTIKKSNLILDN